MTITTTAFVVGADRCRAGAVAVNGRGEIVATADLGIGIELAYRLPPERLKLYEAQLREIVEQIATEASK